MDYQVILSDQFIVDLQAIVEYLVKKADSETAVRVGNELLDRALEVGRYPWTGTPVKLRFGARKVVLYSYAIYYDVNKAERRVEVLRVWHGAREPDSLRLK